MKQILIICLLSAFTIIGFYVNREYWFGWIKKPIEKKEIQIGIVIGYETLDSIPNGSKNTFYGHTYMGAITTGSPCGETVYLGFRYSLKSISTQNATIIGGPGSPPGTTIPCD